MCVLVFLSAVGRGTKMRVAQKRELHHHNKLHEAAEAERAAMAARGVQAEKVMHDAIRKVCDRCSFLERSHD